MFEQQRDQLAAQSFNVDQTNFALESVKVRLRHYSASRHHQPSYIPFSLLTPQDTITTVDAMKGAHKALKTEVKKVKIDDIEVQRERAQAEGGIKGRRGGGRVTPPPGLWFKKKRVDKKAPSLLQSVLATSRRSVFCKY